MELLSCTVKKLSSLVRVQNCSFGMWNIFSNDLYSYHYISGVFVTMHQYLPLSKKAQSRKMDRTISGGVY
jgi:hypothetical protein